VLSNILAYLGQFLSHNENVMLWIQSLELYSQHFIFIVTYELECYLLASLSSLVLYNTLAYWDDS
jgi:hypothetical protein